MTDALDATSDEPSVRRLAELLTEALAAARNGEPAAQNTLQKLAGEHPGLGAVLVREYGDAAARAERRIVQGALSGDKVRQFFTSEWLAEVRASLAEPGDTGLEQMLVSRVALCSLAVNQAECDRAGAWDKGNMSPETADFWDRHVARLDADLLKASRTLAQVRKLRRPVVQLNVAEQQVNVANVTR